MGPGCTDETLLSAIASALHTSTLPITGQLSAAVEKNPGVWLNTAQPLCKAFMVTDDDIRYLAPHAHPHPHSQSWQGCRAGRQPPGSSVCSGMAGVTHTVRFSWLSDHDFHRPGRTGELKRLGEAGPE